MQTTSALYKTKIKEAGRQLKCKISIGNKILTNEDIVEVKIDSNVQPQGYFTIGNTTSTVLDLTLLNKGDNIYSATQIKLEIGLNTGSAIEYVLMGYFNVDDVIKTDYTVKFTAFDNMIKFETPYFSDLGENVTLQQVVNELATKTGVQFEGNVPSYTVKKLDGYTCREILGYVASLCGGNALITREGKFTIVTPSDANYAISTSNYFNYKREEVNYKIGKIRCKVGENELTKGTLGVDSMELQFKNPWVTDSILNDIYTKLNGFNYLGFSMKWQGDISLDIGDIITVTDKRGVVRKHPILSQKFNYTGGLTAEIGAKGESKNKNNFNSEGTVNKQVERYTIEQAHIKKALMDKASIKDLEAERAKIHTLTVDTATIKEVLAGNIKAENIQAEFLQVLKGWMLEGSIGDAQISNLNANKITAGDIDTSKVRVVSKDGAIEITGNQILINDITNPLKPVNRIVIGKVLKPNNLVDYSILIRGKDGNTVMFDSETGVTNAGITSGAVSDNSISDTANIQGYKIDINSVIREVNEKGTVTINGTKIQVGNKTLEVALTEQQNIVNGQQATLKNHETRIKANEDSILLKASKKELDTAVSNIQVGGRNLYLGTKDFLGNRWQNRELYSSDGEYNGFTVLKGSTQWNGLSQSIIAEAGEVYTLSAYVKTDTGSILAYSHVSMTGNAETEPTYMEFGKITDWKHVSFTFKVLTAGQLNARFENSVQSSNIWLCGLKLEKGNKATDWSPAPEDIDNKIDTNVADINKAMTEQSSQILLEAGKIVNEVTSQQITKNEFDAYVELQNTKLTQDKNSWEFKFNQLKQQIDNSGTDNNSKFEAISKYIRFENGNIILGEVGNDLLLTISNNRIYFTQGGSGQEVAYFSNNKLYITNAEILTSIQIGSYSFIPRANGNLSFKWTGGK